MLAINMPSVDSARGYCTPLKVQNDGSGSWTYTNYYLENHMKKGRVPRQ